MGVLVGDLKGGMVRGKIGALVGDIVAAIGAGVLVMWITGRVGVTEQTAGVMSTPSQG